MIALKNISTLVQKCRYELIVGTISLIVSDFLGLIPPQLIKLAVDHVKNVGNPPRIVAAFILLIKWDPFLSYAMLLVSVVGLQMMFRYLWRNHLLGISSTSISGICKNSTGGFFSIQRPETSCPVP
jgi:ABC-type multidrug transport system fused ATPase/permease subunit